MKLTQNPFIRILPPTLIGCVALACGNLIGAKNLFVGAFFIIALAVILYFYTAFCVADRNWLDVRAVFSGAWVGTIGLAALRLTNYQEPWQNKTWLLVGLTYAMFMIGATAGFLAGKKWLPGIAKKIPAMAKGRLQRRENRLYWICIVVTLIGLTCFSANVAIKGYIPCFTVTGNGEYLQFYTKFYLFAVAATGISGLCYYCLVKQKHSILRKIALLFCIFYSTFAFPILAVSRGTFVTSALSLTAAVFYLHRRKLWVLITCLAMILGIYAATSILRGYTDAQLRVFFEPSVITPTETEPSDDPSHEDDIGEGDYFQLSPKMSFLYSYLTVSHDNFNEAVQNTESFTYGARQFVPFNVIVRSARLNQIVEDAETHLVRPHLNTTNLIGDFYYDFGSIGVILCMLLWAFVFGVIQSGCDVFDGPFAYLVAGCTLTPVALCFFATWLSIFAQWMHWGVVLLLALATYIIRKPKQEPEKI